MFADFGYRPNKKFGTNRMNIFAHRSSLSTKTIFSKICSTIKECAELRLARHGSITTSIATPCLYMNDRDVYIETSISTDANGFASIIVSQYKAYNQSALPEFIAASTRKSNDKVYQSERDFKTIPFRNIDAKFILKTDVIPSIQMSMLELADVFRGDLELIRNFRVNGRRPVSVYMPWGCAPTEAESFEQFTLLSGLTWCCI